jgi:NAD(P)-dependent dehydrogenase (short-subunit alcohol dehydrogenase family)
VTVAWSEQDIPDLSGKLAVVTGGNGGLGFETVRALATRGADVVMAARNLDKAAAAAEQLRTRGVAGTVEVAHLDLASLDSVRSFAAGVVGTRPSIDILVNNAGVMGIPRQETADGFEMQLGVNHLGHFALTALLLPALLASGDGRVVTVTSWARFFAGRLDGGDPHLTNGYDPWRAYNQSKLANVRFTIELDHRLHAAGTPVIAVAADPGFAATDLQANSFRLARGASQRFFRSAVRLVGAPPRRGAAPQIRAATDPDTQGGMVYGLRFLFYGSPVGIPIPKRHRDPEQLAALWEVSERETGMPFDVAAHRPPEG